MDNLFSRYTSSACGVPGQELECTKSSTCGRALDVETLTSSSSSLALEEQRRCSEQATVSASRHLSLPRSPLTSIDSWIYIINHFETVYTFDLRSSSQDNVLEISGSSTGAAYHYDGMIPEVWAASIVSVGPYRRLRLQNFCFCIAGPGTGSYGVRISQLIKLFNSPAKELQVRYRSLKTSTQELDTVTTEYRNTVKDVNDALSICKGQLIEMMEPIGRPFMIWWDQYYNRRTFYSRI